MPQKTDKHRKKLPKGVQMIEPDKKAFKDALAKGSFYKDLRAKFGDEAWKLLQDSVGTLG